MVETKNRRPNWRKRPTFVRDEILRLANGKRTADEIALEVGTLSSYVWEVCNAHGATLMRAPVGASCNGTWTDEKIAHLKHRWSVLGESAGKIAAALGVSRSAVCGKAFRLGISHGLSPASSRATIVKVPRPKRERILPAKKIAQLRSLPAEPLPPPKIEDVATVTFDNLTEAHCKWPVYFPSGKTGYCGGKRVPLLPYCDGHCRRAYINYGHVPVTKAPAAAPVTEVV